MKRKAAATVQASAPKKTTKKQKRMKGSSRLADRTSAQELALAKPLKHSQKFSSQPLGLGITKKTSSMNVKISGGKTSMTSTGGGGVDRAPTCTLVLFDSGSSASDGEAAAPVPRRKCPWKSPPLKAIPKPSNVPTVKGTSAQSFTFHLY
jgi:hypothetical protein